MKIKLILLIFTFVIFSATAALGPKSPAELMKKSTFVIKGKVKEIFQRVHMERTDHGNYEITEYLTIVKITKIIKAPKNDIGDLVYIKSYRSKWLGAFKPRPGHSGHTSIPIEGNEYTFYCAEKAGQKIALLPNGIKK